MEKISAKVHVGAASGGVGGGTFAIVLVQILRNVGVPEIWFTPELMILLTGACSYVGTYIGGYLKSA